MRAICLIVLVCMMAPSASAQSIQTPTITIRAEPQDPSEPNERLDEIALTNGRLLRGHVTVVRPDVMTLTIRTERLTVNVDWNEINTASGPSFPPTFARVDVPGPDDARVGFLSERTQFVDAWWGEAHHGPNGQPLGGTLHHARCRTPCALTLPAGSVMLTADHGVAAGRGSRKIVVVARQDMVIHVFAPSDGVALGSAITTLTSTAILTIGSGILLGLAHPNGPMTPFAIDVAKVCVGMVLSGSIGIGIGIGMDMANRRGFEFVRPVVSQPRNAME